MIAATVFCTIGTIIIIGGTIATLISTKNDDKITSVIITCIGIVMFAGSVGFIQFTLGQQKIQADAVELGYATYSHMNGSPKSEFKWFSIDEVERKWNRTDKKEENKDGKNEDEK